MSHWDTLALTAYGGFTDEGRGAVIFQTEGKNTRGFYCSEGEAQKQAAGWPDEQTAEKVRTYDPETQVVCILMHPDGGQSVHRLTMPDPELTPAAAYRRHQQGKTTRSA
jgi:hypothetical protein